MLVRVAAQGRGVRARESRQHRHFRPPPPGGAWSKGWQQGRATSPLSRRPRRSQQASSAALQLEMCCGHGLQLVWAVAVQICALQLAGRSHRAAASHLESRSRRGARGEDARSEAAISHGLTAGSWPALTATLAVRSLRNEAMTSIISSVIIYLGRNGLCAALSTQDSAGGGIPTPHTPPAPPALPAHHRTCWIGRTDSSRSIPNLIAFLASDGKLWPVCRPGKYQHVLYSGHKRIHGLKTQGLVFPKRQLESNVHCPM